MVIWNGRWGIPWLTSFCCFIWFSILSWKVHLREWQVHMVTKTHKVRWNLFKFQFQCCTDTRECSGLTRTFLESPRRIGGPEVFIFTPPSPIPGLLLRSVVALALTCCCKGWFVVDGTERQCKRNVKCVKNG